MKSVSSGAVVTICALPSAATCHVAALEILLMIVPAALGGCLF